MLSFRSLAQVALLASLQLATASPARRATVCNGHAELCSKSYGAVSFVGAHDSYAVGVNNLAANQDYNITQQLNDGVRMLQMQAHNQSGTIQLCHTSCSLLNGGTLQDYLSTVKTWMDANPNDVVTLLIVNIDNLPASSYDTVFKAVGLDTISYSPPSATLTASTWPALGDMIDKNTRLVTFLDNGASFDTIPYLIDEFTNVWETAFDVTDPNGFDCNVNRTKGDTTTQMYLINHFLDTLVFGQPAPFPAQANVTNGLTGASSLGQQVQTCTTQNTRPPNYLLVDFYEYGGGSVFQVAASINGVQYSPTTPIATPKPTDTASGGSGSNGALPFSYEKKHFVTSIVVAGSIVLGALVV